MEIQKHNNFNSFFSQTKYKYPTKPFFFFFEIFGISLAIIKNKKPLKKKKRKHNTTDDRLTIY